jgi:hypothetical protein
MCSTLRILASYSIHALVAMLSVLCFENTFAELIMPKCDLSCGTSASFHGVCDVMLHNISSEVVANIS